MRLIQNKPELTKLTTPVISLRVFLQIMRPEGFAYHIQEVDPKLSTAPLLQSLNRISGSDNADLWRAYRAAILKNPRLANEVVTGFVNNAPD